MTYGKVRRNSNYLRSRSHPYSALKRPSSREYTDDKNKDSDLWNTLNSFTKYIVTSASDLVRKIAGSSKQSPSADSVPYGTSVGVSARPNVLKYDIDKENSFWMSDIDQMHTQTTKSWVNHMMKDPSLSERVKLETKRILQNENRDNFHHDTAPGSDRRNRRYMKPHDPTTSKILCSQISRFQQKLSISRPSPLRLAFGEIDSRSEVSQSTPRRQSSNQTSMNRSASIHLGSKTDAPMAPSSSYRRPWSSTLTSSRKFVSRGVGTSPRIRRSKVFSRHKPKELQWKSPVRRQKSSAKAMELKTYSPIYPRKIFSWEQSGRKDRQNNKRGSTDYPMIRTYKDSNIESVVPRSLDLDSPKIAKEDTCRLNNKVTSKGSPRSNLSSSAIGFCKKRKSHIDMESEPISKRARVKEIKERTALKLDSSKVVDQIDDDVEDDEPVDPVHLSQPNEQGEMSPVTSAQGKPTTDTTKLESTQICMTVEKSAIQVFPSTELTIPSKPLIALSTAPTSEENCGAKTAEADSGCTLEQGGRIFNLPKKLDQSDVVGLEDGGDKQQEIEGCDNKINSPLPPADKNTAELSDLQRQPRPEINENVSYACRLAKLTKIKIRDHYTSKIEELYDQHCMENGKEARKMKAVAMYRDKYHPLGQDHLFFVKLCKQYKVDPGKEYEGVDSDVKTIKTRTINEEQSKKDDKDKIIPDVVPFPAGVSPIVPKTNVPHYNPFDIDHVKIATQETAGGSILKNNSLKADGNGTSKDNSVFGSTSSNHTSGNSQTNAAKDETTKSLFVAKDPVATNNINPFSLPAKPEQTLFSLSNTKTRASVSLFGNMSEMKNNFALDIKPTVKESENPFNCPNPLEVSMMDADIPEENNAGSVIPQQNLFGSSNSVIGSGKSTSLFASSINKVGSLSTTNLFGNPSQKIPQASNRTLFTGINSTRNFLTSNQFGAKLQPAQSNNLFSKHSVNVFSTAGSSQVFGAGSGVFSNSPFSKSTFSNTIDLTKGPKFSLGSLGPPKSRKRRPIVRGRRTLK